MSYIKQKKGSTVKRTTKDIDIYKDEFPEMKPLGDIGKLYESPKWSAHKI